MHTVGASVTISEFATEEADDARVVDQEVYVRCGRGGGSDLRRVGHIELEGHDAEPWRSTSGSRVERLRAAAYTFFTPAAASPVAAYGKRAHRCGAPRARYCSRSASVVHGAFPRVDDGGGSEGHKSDGSRSCRAVRRRRRGVGG